MGKKRLKPGRKEIKDKKKPVTVYVRESQIDEHGGIEKARIKVLAMFEQPNAL